MFTSSFDKHSYVKYCQWKSTDYLPSDKKLAEVESIFKKQLADSLDNYRRCRLENLFFECVLNISNIQFEIHNKLLKYKREQFIKTILNKNINQISERLLNKVSQILLVKTGSDLKPIFIEPKFGLGTDCLSSHEITSFKQLFLSIEMQNNTTTTSLRNETIDSIWICCLFKTVLEILIETDYGKQIVVEEVKSIILSPDENLKQDNHIKDELQNKDNKITKNVYKQYIYFAEHQGFQPVLDLSCSLNGDEIILGVNLPKKPNVSNILGLEVYALDGSVFTVDLSNWSRLYMKDINKDTEFPIVIYLREFPKLVRLHFLVRFLLCYKGETMEGPLSNTVSCTLK
ncbi:uncharacterized protein [Onthophagus taurus]|uniref:uncharacterized protein isoform X1 n=1 Tax=Onthophagus taurus TaxID=166361 RepID=UPI0039BDC3B8